MEAKNAVLVTTPGFVRRGVAERIQRLMNGRLRYIVDTVTANPDVDHLDEVQRTMRKIELDCIIALGGGSSIDTGKALSRALAVRSHSPLSDLLRRRLPCGEKAEIPVVAVPATAGTGSEVTPTATVWDHKERFKYSLTGDDLFPTLAVVDPCLTLSLPDRVTVSSGLDAVSHALESVWNTNATPFTIALATHSLRLSIHSLPLARSNPNDLESRSSMMMSSLMAGFAISQTRTALSHSVSYPLTLDFDIPHGIAASFALPEILEFNALGDDGRLSQMSLDLGYSSIRDFGEALRKLLSDMELPSAIFSQIQIDQRMAELGRRMLTKERVGNNIRLVEPMDVDRIVKSAIGRYRTSEKR